MCSNHTNHTSYNHHHSRANSRSRFEVSVLIFSSAGCVIVHEERLIQTKENYCLSSVGSKKISHKFLFNVADQIIDVFFPLLCLMNFRFSLFLQLVSCLKRLNVLTSFPSFKEGFTRFIVLFCLVFCDKLGCCFGYCV